MPVVDVRLQLRSHASAAASSAGVMLQADNIVSSVVML